MSYQDGFGHTYITPIIIPATLASWPCATTASTASPGFTEQRPVIGWDVTDVAYPHAVPAGAMTVKDVMYPSGQVFTRDRMFENLTEWIANEKAENKRQMERTRAEEPPPPSAA